MQVSNAILAVLLGATLCAGDDTHPTPRFNDSARRAKLERAFPEFDRLLEKYKQDRGIPGLVYGIVIDGELAHLKAFGVQDRDTNAPVTADTRFRIASMTKSFTALAILRLRDEGKLSLDDPVAKWIPEVGKFKYPTRDTAPIRVRQLMTHGAGFPEDNPWGDRQLAVPDATMADWLEKGLPFSTTPDTEFEYSNYGFALLGRIVAAASGVPYREYMEKQILAPLGMAATTLEPSTVPAQLHAKGYHKSGESYTVVPDLAHGSFGAMGGMVTSANDLARYVAFHLSAYPPRDEEDRGPVRRASVREMQRMWRDSGLTETRPGPDQPLRVEASGYGYGLRISRDCRFAHVVGHGGGLPGFGSYMIWLPDYGVGLFAMANLTYSGPGSLLNDAFNAMLATGGLVKRQLPPSPDLQAAKEALVALWSNWDQDRLDAFSANNLPMDGPGDTYREAFKKVKNDLGECNLVSEVEPENWLRGRFRMTCERGAVDIVFTLAPTNPPGIQALALIPAKNLDTRMQSAAARLAGSRKEFHNCRVGQTVSSDGVSTARVLLECGNGKVELGYRLEADGTPKDVVFARPARVACLP